MILIAPDKFKGTLTARQVCEIVSREFPDCLLCPMADGGEGTAEAIAATTPGWIPLGSWYLHPDTSTAAIDSSAVIGPAAYTRSNSGIMDRSSAPLGEVVKEILNDGAERVVIGIGGTFTCDGGEGFLRALGPEPLESYRSRIIGLSDVQVPLVAPIGEPSALMFAPQKGATTEQIPLLAKRLTAVQSRYGGSSPFDGAGGGLGYAIASAIGAPCYAGAEYVLGLYKVPWDRITLAITGEGRIDSQTAQGKVVSVVAREATRRGIPVVAIGGCVEPGASLGSDIPSDLVQIISTEDFPPAGTLTHTTAALRLAAAARTITK